MSMLRFEIFVMKDRKRWGDCESVPLTRAISNPPFAWACISSASTGAYYQNALLAGGL